MLRAKAKAKAKQRVHLILHTVSTVWQFKLHILFHFIALCVVWKTATVVAMVTMVVASTATAKSTMYNNNIAILIGPLSLQFYKYDGCKRANRRPNEFLIVLQQFKQTNRV